MSGPWLILPENMAFMDRIITEEGLLNDVEEPGGYGAPNLIEDLKILICLCFLKFVGKV